MYAPKQSLPDKGFVLLNYLLLSLVGLCAIFPFYYIVIASITPPVIANQHLMLWVPLGFSLEAYRAIFDTITVPRALLVSIWLTVSGVLLYLALNILTAYPLSFKNLVGRRPLLAIITFTLVFSGGFVPLYLVVVSLGLYNSFWAVLLPGAVSAYNVIIFRSFFENIPEELKESARIDGCGEWKTLLSIILPVCKPLIATFVILFGVGIWNSWFNAVLFLNDPVKWPVQVVLRLMLTTGNDSSTENVQLPGEMLKMAVIVVSTLPILIVYPFAQKYFTQGMLVGSVKG